MLFFLENTIWFSHFFKSKGKGACGAGGDGCGKCAGCVVPLALFCGLSLLPLCAPLFANNTLFISWGKAPFFFSICMVPRAFSNSFFALAYDMPLCQCLGWFLMGDFI